MEIDLRLNSDQLAEHLRRIREIMLELQLNPDWAKTKPSENKDDPKEGIAIEDFIQARRKSEMRSDHKYLLPVRVSEILDMFRVESFPNNMTYKRSDRKQIIIRYLMWLIPQYADTYINLYNEKQIYFWDGDLLRSSEYDDGNGEIIKYLRSAFKLRSDGGEFSDFVKDYFANTKHQSQYIIPQTYYHVDLEDYKLYFYNGDQILILDGDYVNSVKNGSIPVIFEDDKKYVPFEYALSSFNNPHFDLSELSAGVLNYDPSVNSSEILDGIIRDISLDGERFQTIGMGPLGILAERCHFDDSVLNKRQQAILYYLLIFALPFSGSIESRPFVNFIGREGSGKTTAAKQIGRLLYGSEFKPVVLTDDKRDFQSNMTDVKIRLFDNVEKSDDWFVDYVAACSTNVEFSQRQMRTNFDVISVNPTAVIMVTCKKPSWVAPEISERVLPFYFQKFEEESDHDYNENQAEYESETWLLKNIDNNRNGLMTLYIRELNKVLKKLKERGGLRGSSSHRLTEFTILIKTINSALHVCPEEELENILDGLNSHRSLFALREQPWFDPVLATVESSSGEVSYSASGLMERAVFHGYEGSKRQLFKGLSEYNVSLKRLLGYSHTNKGGHLYNFSRLKATNYEWKSGYQLFDLEKPTLNGQATAILNELPDIFSKTQFNAKSIQKIEGVDPKWTLHYLKMYRGLIYQHPSSTIDDVKYAKVM